MDEEKEVEMTEESKKMLDALLSMSTRIGIPEEPPERYRRKD